MAIWTLLFSTILLPLFSIALLWRRARRPLSAWVSTFLMAAGLTGFSVLAAPWGWFGVGVRYAMALLFLAALVLSLRRPIPAEQNEGTPLRMVVKVLIFFLFGGVAFGALRARRVPADAVDLRFPLRGGAYLIHHGGSDSAANMHASHPAQRYGLDIVKLNAAGMRARGLYPADLSRYAIWGEAVYSPCDGVVMGARDGLPDNPRGVMDAKNAPGNHVVVRCDGTDVMLAHLEQGSVAVRPNMRVTPETMIGRVGNSGNTSEPHLHVHAQRGAHGVPARFDGRWLVRNAVVR